MTDKPIPLAKPDIDEAQTAELLASFADIIQSGHLSIGPILEQFESAVAARADRKYGIGVNSGTSGLHLCVKSLGLGPGDEVITTPFTFIATVNCLLYEGAKPVLVDIDPQSYNVAPAEIEKAITDKTKAILPVEVFGNPTHFDTYEQIAKTHDLLLIEDSCEAMGASLNSRAAGSFGECGVFAFYPNKQITAGEGGMIVTDREDIRDMCVSLRNQGRATEAWFSHARLGYNYRLSELQATVGLTQIKRLDQLLARRVRAADLYNQALSDIEQIHLPPMSRIEKPSWFVYVIRLSDEFTQADRDAIIGRLRDKGIGCSSYFVPIHTKPYIRDILGTSDGDFPVTERIAARTIALPFFGGLSAEQVDRVRDSIVEALASIGKNPPKPTTDVDGIEEIKL